MTMRPTYCQLILMLCLLFFAVRVKAGVLTQTPIGAEGKQSQEEFVAEVKRNFEQRNFAALDTVAFQARESKERFPGGDWKLYVFYQALTWPNSGAMASDQQWNVHLKLMQAWKDSSPDSMTARIAQAGAWIEYAKKARNSEHTWSQIEKRKIGGKEYQERLSQAKKALDFDIKRLGGILATVKREYTPKPTSNLPSLCPHWYVVRLALEQGEQWEWNRYNNFFSAGAALEPTYYHLYQVKAVDLMPSQHGFKSQWEAFADNSARAVGGKEGDILYYMIVSHVRPTFELDNPQDKFLGDSAIQFQQLWSGYKEIEEKYGVSKFRMNEMAMLASSAKQWAVATTLFDQIGDNWDESIWKRRASFEAYRNLAQTRAPKKPDALQKNDISHLKTTISTRRPKYLKSQDVVIEAVIENLAEQSENPNGHELSIPALSLVIQDSKKLRQEAILLPLADNLERMGKIVKPGEFIRLSYRPTSPLPAGMYTVKMKSMNSNQLAIQIGGSSRASR